MPTTALAGLSAIDIIEYGLAAEQPSDWHTEAAEDWYWHASQLSNCPRQLVLRRAGMATDGRTVKSQLTMRIGTVFHAEMESWVDVYLSAHPELEVVVKEVGYRHPTMRLAAKPDLLCRWNGEPVLIDYKTEMADAGKRRRKDQETFGWESSARMSHRIQLVATAMVLEANLGISLTHGRIWYFAKDTGWIDEQIVSLDDANVRGEVVRLHDNLERAWEMYADRGVLPGGVWGDPEEGWMCKPRSDADPKGQWCEARLACIAARVKGC